jgi:hypothetical protein
MTIVVARVNIMVHWIEVNDDGSSRTGHIDSLLAEHKNEIGQSLCVYLHALNLQNCDLYMISIVLAPLCIDSVQLLSLENT